MTGLSRYNVRLWRMERLCVHNQALFVPSACARVRLCLRVCMHGSVHCTNTGLVSALPPSTTQNNTTHTNTHARAHGRAQSPTGSASQTIHTLSCSKNTVSGGGNGVTWLLVTQCPPAPPSGHPSPPSPKQNNKQPNSCDIQYFVFFWGCAISYSYLGFCTV